MILVFSIVVVLLITTGGTLLADPMLIDGQSVDESGSKPQQSEKSKGEKLKGEIRHSDFSPGNRLRRVPESHRQGTGAGFSGGDFKLNSTRQQPVDNRLLLQSPAAAPVPSILNPEPLKGETDIETAKLNTQANEDKTQSASGSTNATEKEKGSNTKRTVVVRIRRVVSNFEAEIAESALKIALTMVKKQDPNTTVIVFLDLDAVSLADGEFNFFDQVSTSEEGNSRSISLKSMRALLQKFGTEGGKIVVSERWAKIRGFHRKTNTIVPGSVLTDEDGIAQMLLDASNVIDY